MFSLSIKIGFVNWPNPLFSEQWATGFMRRISFSHTSQLFAYQTRLWRVARMFLDPQLQLKKIKDQRVIEVFTKELGVSETMANLELRRYKYDNIGQAPSYFQGYLIVKKMREDAQIKFRFAFPPTVFQVVIGKKS